VTHRSRILVISQIPPPVHGSTVMTQTLLDTLHALGHETRLLDRRFSASVEEIGKFSGRKILAALGLAARVAYAASRHGELCIFFITNRPQSFVVDYVLSRILIALRVPYVSYIHTHGYTELARRGKAWRWMVRGLLGSSSAVVVLSERLAADVRPWVPVSNIHCIENTPADVRVPSPPPEELTLGTTVTVLYLSNLIPEKGVLDFIEIGKELSARSSTSSFLFNIVGAGASEAYQDTIRRAILESGSAGCFRLRGAQHGDSKWEFLREADVLIFPSRYPYEAQPLTIIEALSVGTPVVAYPTGGIPDLITSGVDGVLADGVMDAVDAVLSLIRDPSSSGRISAGALETFERRFSRDAFATAWSRVLEREY
jgi:glycosyltransferase involved in cell wall biosynthesis